MPLDKEEMTIKTQGTQKEITNTIRSATPIHTAKGAMVTSRFTANKVDPGLHFTSNFGYVKYNSHDQITGSM